MQGITAQRIEKPKSLSPIKRPGGSFPHVTRELSERKASKTSSAAPISDFFFLQENLLLLSRDGVNRSTVGSPRGIMSSQGFSFPPPPPPPPVPQASSATPHGQHWNARSSGRGRGRGQGNRGRGGNHNSNGSRQSYQNTNNGYNYAPGNYGYPTQPVSATSYMPPPYPHTQTNFQQPQNPSSYQPPQTFHQPAGSAAFQPLPHYAGPSLTTPSASYPPQTTPYPPNVAHQHASPPSNPILMNSVPWGTEVPAAPAPAPAPATTSYGGVTHAHPHGHGHGHGPRGSWSSHSQGNHNNHGPKSRPQNKRDHSAAFNKPQSNVPRTPAPPAVPSFGNPLPCKPPPAADVTSTTRRPRKRKRKHNQLGLTPKTEEHESSEDEEDVDEESTFAAAGSECAPLQFSYRGKTATLQSSADIAAWIAERKKKFPTKERVEEKKKAIQEAKETREAARKEKMNEKANEHKGKQKDHRKNSDTNPESAMDAATIAQRKADKIRRNLDREQKRIAKAEAEAEAARLKIAALQKQLGSDERHKETETEVGTEDGIGNGDEAEPKEIIPETSEAFDPMTLDTGKNRSEAGALTAHANSIPAGADPVANQLDDPMDLSSEESNASDWTSSSGSGSDEESDSDNESDSDSGSDSAPEQASSRRQGPERVPPPPREGKKQLCRHFARSGQCNRGDQCNFSHDVSERERRKAKPEKKEKEKKERGRKGILSAVSPFIFLD